MDMRELKEPYEMFGIECDEGWKSLYQPLIDYITKYNSEHEDSEIIITQVKEKFGGLRFYVAYDNVPEEVRNELSEKIRNAEAESYVTCEVCGTKENVGMTQGWLKTICISCLLDTMDIISKKTWRRDSDGTVYTIEKMIDKKKNVKKD